MPSAQTIPGGAPSEYTPSAMPSPDTQRFSPRRASSGGNPFTTPYESYIDVDYDRSEKKMPIPPHPCPSQTALTEDYWEAVTYLKQTVPVQFWMIMKAKFEESGLKNQEALQRYNRNVNASIYRSLRKWYSYFGACRITQDTPWWFTNQNAFWCIWSFTFYVDLGNAVYRRLMTDAWPSLTEHMSNAETLGDCLEALLGLFYIKKVLYNRRISALEDTIITAIEVAAFSLSLLMEVHNVVP